MTANAYTLDVMRLHFVYVLRDHTGSPLYVGCTNDVERRVEDHSRTQDWWPDVGSVETRQFTDRREALSVENRLQHELQPEYNALHGPPGEGDCSFFRYCGEQATRSYWRFVDYINRPSVCREYPVCDDHYSRRRITYRDVELGFA